MRRDVKIALGYLAAVIVFVTVIGVMALFVRNGNNSTPSDESLGAQSAGTFSVDLSGVNAENAIEDFLQINLREVTNVRWAEAGDIYRLRFDATPDRLRGILRGSPVIDCPEMTLNEGYQTRFANLDGPAWWFDRLPTNYAGVDCVSSNGDIYRTLVNNAASVWTVYMEITLN